jgi:hypothetical protein
MSLSKQDRPTEIRRVIATSRKKVQCYFVPDRCVTERKMMRLLYESSIAQGVLGMTRPLYDVSLTDGSLNIRTDCPYAGLALD